MPAPPHVGCYEVQGSAKMPSAAARASAFAENSVFEVRRDWDVVRTAVLSWR
jgi:hypothetical protein